MSRFIPASAAPQSSPAGPSAPAGPSTLQRFLPALGQARTVGGIANTALGGGQLTGGATNALLDGLGAFSGFGNMAQQIQQGQPVPAALGGLSGLGSLSRIGANAFTPGSTLGSVAGVTPNPAIAGGLGTAAGALGGIGGLVGGGLALSQGQYPAGITGLLSGAGGLASLAPATATLGGVPLSAAGASAGAGATAGATAGASIAGMLGAVVAPVALGVALHPFFQKWSSPDSDYLIEQRNNAVMGGQAQGGLGAFRGATDLPTSLAILQNTAYAPGQDGGTEGNAATYRVGWRDATGAMSPALLEQALRDPAAMRQLISTLDVRMGQGGATESNHALTDYYRRELAHRAGLTDTAGLFQPAPAGNPYDPTRMARGILDGSAWTGSENWNNASQGFPTAGSTWAGNWQDPALFAAIDQLTSPGGLQSVRLPVGRGYGYLDVPVSQRFRAPGELTVAPGVRNALLERRDSLLRDQQTQADILREYQTANAAL